MRLFRAALMVMVACVFTVSAATGQGESGGVIAFTAGTFDAQDIYLLDVVSGDQVNLTQKPGSYSAPLWSPDGALIAFTWSGDIYVMAGVGASPRRLTFSTGVYDGLAHWSPDGQSITFISRQVDEQAESIEINLVDLASGHIQHVSTAPADLSSLTFSPDFRLLAGIEDAYGSDAEIIIIDLATTAVRRLSTLHQSLNSLEWFPDNQTLLFQVSDAMFNTDRLYTIDITSGEVNRLNRDYLSYFRPKISPDGGQVAFVSTECFDVECITDLFVLNLEDASTRNLSQTQTIDESGAVWSPDGTEIVFKAYTGEGISNLFLVNVGTGEKRQLTQYGVWSLSEASWQP